MVPRRTIIAERVLADAGLFDRVRMEECVPLSTRAAPRSTSQYPSVPEQHPLSTSQYPRSTRAAPPQY